MNFYRFGFDQHVSASDWTDGQAYTVGPFWYRTESDRDMAASQLVRLGDSVTLLSR